MMKRCVLSIITVVAVVSVAGVAFAVPMQTLFDGASLEVNSLLFTDWQLLQLAYTDPRYVPNFSEIDVSPIVDRAMLGLRFEVFSDQLYVEDENFIDVTFAYNVGWKGPTHEIKGNTLAITLFIPGRADDWGDPLTAIVEDVYSRDGKFIVQKLVEASYSIENKFDQEGFGVRRELSVVTNLLVAGLFPGDTANLFSFEQKFLIPEPSTVILLGTGLVGIVVVGRKRVIKVP